MSVKKKRKPALRHAPRRRAKAIRARPKKRARSAARFQPLLLSKLIGRRALRSPPAGLEAPALPAARPQRDGEGRPLPDGAADLAALDSVDPAAFGRDRRPGPHWDGEVWHDGAERGLSLGGGWLPLLSKDGRWWAFAGGSAQVRHDGAWWIKENGLWYVVHQGRPWAWRSFQDWGAQGLFEPRSGAEMVYSADFSRVAMITPGDGAVVFDAATGEKLARIPEERMPPRRRPKVPAEMLHPPEGFAR